MKSQLKKWLVKAPPGVVALNTRRLPALYYGNIQAPSTGIEYALQYGLMLSIRHDKAPGTLF
ncbi:MAG: hypothetical protein Q8P42_02185 [Gallionella sp.]|nr:hypothetical protein [Gallionella sp.]